PAHRGLVGVGLRGAPLAAQRLERRLDPQHPVAERNILMDSMQLFHDPISGLELRLREGRWESGVRSTNSFSLRIYKFHLWLIRSPLSRSAASACSRPRRAC